jgi:hypothetical protein
MRIAILAATLIAALTATVLGFALPAVPVVLAGGGGVYYHV